MKKILVVQYSQSGQLTDVVAHLVEPLRGQPDISLATLTVKPAQAYPFPWPILRFFDTFPEAVYLDPPPLQPFDVDPGERFDLVILGYQAWFLSPSLPITGFLKSPAAKQLLAGTPVVTVVACRDMWLMAQEQVRKLLADCGARLIGHVALVDEAGSVGSFLATPLWVWTGNRGPRLGGLIPRAGVRPAEIANCRRFGERIASALRGKDPLDESLLRNLDAVRVNERLISSERAIRSGFRLWGRLLRALGPQGAFSRKPALLLYIVWLVAMILTVVPLAALLKALFAPLTRARIAAQKAYYSAPSGSR